MGESVWFADVLDPKIYPRAKFISEFGFQSWPSWQLHRQVTVPADWSPHSDMSEFRCAHHTLSITCIKAGNDFRQILKVGTAAVLTLACAHAARVRHADLYHVCLLSKGDFAC